MHTSALLAPAHARALICHLFLHSERNKKHKMECETEAARRSMYNFVLSLHYVRNEIEFNKMMTRLGRGGARCGTSAGMNIFSLELFILISLHFFPPLRRARRASLCHSIDERQKGCASLHASILICTAAALQSSATRCRHHFKLGAGRQFYFSTEFNECQTME